MKHKNEALRAERSLLSTILCFALPLIATSLLQLVFNTADTIMVGRWGGSTPEECTAAMAAVGSCTSLVNLFVNATIGLSVGCGIAVAHRATKGREGELSTIIHTGVTLAAFIGIGVLLVGALLARPILRAMDTDTAVLSDAVAYFRVYLFGMPACVVYNFCAATLRARGDTVRPLIFLSIGGACNVILNAIAVVGLQMGAVGVGLATAASQWLSCSLVLVYMMRTTGEYRLFLRSLGIRRAALSAILAAGVPAAVQSMLFNLSALILQSAVNGFGTAVVAGNTAAMNLEGYIYTTQNALYHTAMMLIARALGAGDLTRIGRVKRISTVTVGVVGITVGMTVFLLSTPLLSLYVPESAEALHAGCVRLATVAPVYFLCGMMEVGSGSLRGMGRSLLPTFVSLVGCCVLRVVWVMTLFRILAPTLTLDWALCLLYLCFPISWLLTALIQHLLAARELCRLKKRVAPGEV